MSRPQIVFILARAANGVIGWEGALPWHIPADLKRFKALTMGMPMVMGRRTFESFPRPLPGRRHIVLTRALGWRADGAEVARSAADALALAGPVDAVSVIGGAEIFALYLSRADRIELTEVAGDIAGDVVVPPFDPAIWRENLREDHPALAGVPAHSFVTLVRRAPLA